MIFFKDQGREKISTTAIQLVFRGLKFDSDTDIDGKDSFRLGTQYENELDAARYQGKHVATIASKLKE